MKQNPLIMVTLVGVIWCGNARADIYECNGTWTNKPCQGAAKKTLKEEVGTPRSQAAIDHDKRESWLLDLQIRRGNANRNYHLDIDIEDTELLCRDTKISLEACRIAVSAKQNLIDDKVLAARDLELRNKEVAAKQNATPLPALQENKVTVIQNNIKNDFDFRSGHGARARDEHEVRIYDQRVRPIGRVLGHRDESPTPSPTAVPATTSVSAVISGAESR